MITDTPNPTIAERLAEGGWRLDSTRSSVEFRARTLWGRATVRGHFDRYAGTLVLARRPAIELAIDAASLDTGLAFRDRHLRSEDFFDVEHHPEIRFESDDVTVDGNRLHVTGRLYAAGSSLPLALEATLRRAGEGIEFDARTTADHRQLGMSHGTLGMIPSPSELHVQGRLVR